MDSPKKTIGGHDPSMPQARAGRARADRSAKKRMKRKVLTSRDQRYEMRIQAAHRNPHQVAVLRISRREANGEFVDVLHVTGEELLVELEKTYGPMAYRAAM